MRKNKILLFLFILSLGIIVTYPAFVPSHALDSYCTIDHGYNNTALWFLQNGRIFSALFLWIRGVVNLPYDSIGFVSLFLSSIFIALSIICIYNSIKNKKNTLNKFILLISLFLIFYTPLFVEVLLLDEVCIISLGILFISLASIRIYNGGIKNYLLALLFTFLGVSCYQGIACYLIPLLLILFIINNDKLNSLFKKIGISILIYGISFILNLIVIKIVSLFTNETISKIGDLNLIGNLFTITKDFIPNSLQHLFGFANVKIYYFFVIMLLAISIYFIIKNDNKKRNIIFMIVLLLSIILMPFVPNIFMNSSSNYTAARMTLTLMMIPSSLIIYIISLFDINKFKYILLVLLILLFGFYFYCIKQNTTIDLKRYKQDMKYLQNITERITKYEKESGNKVTTIYYAKDKNVNYYYSFGNANGANIRLVAVNWALECAWQGKTNHKYKFESMSLEKYKEYFDGKDYEEFDKEQLVFDGDTLYLLLYYLTDIKKGI
jgi:hypothetical protein